MFTSLIIVNTYDYAFRKSHFISVVSCPIEHYYACIYLHECTSFMLCYVWLGHSFLFTIIFSSVNLVKLNSVNIHI